MRDFPTERRAHAILLTGMPGVGKTTVIRRVAVGLGGRRIRGFTTEEIRKGGQRLGFRLETFDGQSTVLSHVDIRSGHRVGKYGVDVVALDRVVDSALSLVDPPETYLIDEIGKMECLSVLFIAAITKLLDSSHPLVATITARGRGLIEQAKQRPDVEVWEVTRQNRDGMPDRVISEVLRGESLR